MSKIGKVNLMNRMDGFCKQFGKLISTETWDHIIQKSLEDPQYLVDLRRGCQQLEHGLLAKLERESKPANDGAVIIAVTGGIGSGKSTVSREFNKLGAYRIDVDVLAAECMKPDKPLFKAIVEYFGHRITENGWINRKKLADIVFNSPEDLKILNNMSHPYVIHELMHEIGPRRHMLKAIVIDIPLLFESGLHERDDAKIINEIIVVTAPLEERFERLRIRMSRDQAEKRMAAQWTDEQRLIYADYEIRNDSDILGIGVRVREIWGELQKLHSRTW